MKRPIVVVLVMVLALALVPAESRGSSGPDADPPVVYAETQDIGRPNRIAVIEVAGWGEIRIELYENMTPITTSNFIDLAESGFYDGIKFHRCIDDFVAQTGDPNTKNNNPYDDGSGGSGTTIPLEVNYNATHIDGAVGMARSSEPDTASSQFYICDGPQHGLDEASREGDGQHGYAVFGVVIEGLDVAKKIAACQTYPDYRPLLKDHPVDDIVMTSVTIEDGVWENETLDNETEKGKTNDAPIPFAVLPSALVLIAIIAARKRL